jgi:hypothetical protein
MGGLPILAVFLPTKMGRFGVLDGSRGTFLQISGKKFRPALDTQLAVQVFLMKMNSLVIYL